MQKITYEREYFEPQSTLGCGQTFRFRPWRRDISSARRTGPATFTPAGTKLLWNAKMPTATIFITISICRAITARSAAARKVTASKPSAPPTEKGGDYASSTKTKRKRLFPFSCRKITTFPASRASWSASRSARAKRRSFWANAFLPFRKRLSWRKRTSVFLRISARATARNIFLRPRKRSLRARSAGAPGKARRRPARATDGAVRRRPRKWLDCIALFAYHDTGAFPVIPG